MSNNTVKQDFSTKISMNNKGAWRRLFRMIAMSNFPKYMWLLIIPLYFINSINQVVWMLYPEQIAKVMDGDVSQGTILLAVFFMCFQSVWNLLTSTYTTFIRLVFPKKFNEILIEKSLKLPASFYDEFNSRELLSRITSDSSMFGLFITTPIQFITVIQGLIVSLLVLNEYDTRLVLYLFASFPVLLIVNFFVSKLKFIAASRVQLNKSKTYRYIADILKNVSVVKVFSSEDKETKKSGEEFTRLNKANNFSAIVRNISVSYNSVAMLLMSIGAMFLGYFLIGDGDISFGVWFLFYTFFRQIVSNFTYIFSMYLSFREVQGSLNFATYVLGLDDEDYSGDDVPTMGSIVFKDVDFSYNEEKTVLNNINIEFTKGKHTALVGSSGSGKTTILTLLERLYHNYGGEITMDGIDVSTFDLNQWRSNFIYVTQKVTLYSGTIRDNLLYGIDSNVSDERIYEILKKVNLDSFINELPNGLDTVTAESGDNLSGGERQRLALANAFLSEAEYILLDEATSNLDAESEVIVLKTIQELSKTKTVISIAHRLSTIKSADQIVVLVNGETETKGNFAEVSKKSKLFKELFQQTGEVNDEK